MKAFTVGIADSAQMIHDIFDNVSKIYHETIKVEHFYSINEVEDFLYDNPDGLDMLFLEVVFEDSKNGIELLPYIRAYAPELPICLITVESISVEIFLKICKKYNVELINKPVEKLELLAKIMLNKKNHDNYKKTYERLYEYSQYIDLIEKDNECLSLEKAVEQANVKNTISEINALIEENKQIPKGVYTLVQDVFPNLEFASNVLLELLNKGFDKKLYKFLKALNDKNILSSSVKKELCIAFGIDNLYRYRVSQNYRVYVQEIDGQRPLVYIIDYPIAKS